MSNENKRRLVLDTNIFVAAGFNKRSSAAKIIQRLREGDWILVWDQATRRETEKVLTQIPPLSWPEFAPLFRPEHEFRGKSYPQAFAFIEDEDDRKFAALATAAGAILVSNDDHLLSKKDLLEILLFTSGELIRHDP